jgi:hypothetical protein
VARLATLRRTRRSLPPGGRRNDDFVENPLGFGRFLGKIETEMFCKIW